MPEEEVIVYKAVAALPDGTFISLMGNLKILSLHPDWIATYQIGVWTHPPQPGSKLFAYYHLHQAVRAAGRENPRTAIFKAKATGTTPITQVALEWNISKALRAYWDIHESLHDSKARWSLRHSLLRLPSAYPAVVCAKIMLLEEVS